MRLTPPPPPPMPAIAAALLHIDDAKNALSRHIWNKSQLEDAIRSAEFFIALAKKNVLTQEPV